MPTIEATSGFCARPRMAEPVRVRDRKRWSATSTTTVMSAATIRDSGTDTGPSWTTSERYPSDTVRVSVVQIITATLSSTTSRPKKASITVELFSRARCCATPRCTTSPNTKATATTGTIETSGSRPDPVDELPVQQPAEDEHGAVGQLHDPQDPEDQAQADGQAAVDAAEQHPVDERLQDRVDVHVVLLRGSATA